MKKDEFYFLATKYLSKEASDEEVEQLMSLLQQKRYATVFSWIGETWEKAGQAESSSGYNADRGFALLTAKIRESDPFYRREKERSRVSFFQSSYLRAAASFAALAAIVLGALFVINVVKQRAGSIAWNEKKTVMGEKSIVTLLDGTRIMLNADSKMKYPVRFGEESRDVFLEGEAYFEVIQDSQKPFVVHTGKVSTTDLGTKFNVSAFPDEEAITISLEEGTVVVSTGKTGAGKKDVVLIPTQQLIYHKADETSNIESFEREKTIGWKDNVLVFDNEPLSKILLPLERYYGVKFELADQSLAHRTVKANFKNESFWTVAEVLKKATGLRARTVQENNELKKIVFYE